MNNIISIIDAYCLAPNNRLKLHAVYKNNNTMWLDTAIRWGENNYKIMRNYLKINAREINKTLASNNYTIMIQEDDGHIRSLHYKEFHPGRNLLDSKLTQHLVGSGVQDFSTSINNLKNEIRDQIQTRGRSPLKRIERPQPMYTKSFCNFIMMINDNIGKWHNYEAIIGQDYPEFIGMEKIHCDYLKKNNYSKEYYEKILDEVIESNRIYSSSNRNRSRSRERHDSYVGPFRDSYRSMPSDSYHSMPSDSYRRLPSDSYRR